MGTQKRSESGGEPEEARRHGPPQRQFVEQAQVAPLEAESRAPGDARVPMEKRNGDRDSRAVDWQVFEFFSGIGGLHAGWDRAVEIFNCASSAFASAVVLQAPVCRAYDVNATANQVYVHNFGLSPQHLSLEHLPASLLGAEREGGSVPSSAAKTATAREAMDAMRLDAVDETKEVKKANASTRRTGKPTPARDYEQRQKPKPKKEADVWLLSPPCQPYTRGGKREDLHDPRARGLLNLLDCLERLADPPKLLFLENVRGFEESQTRARLLKVLRQRAYQVEEFLLSPTQLGFPNTRVRYYCLATRAGGAEEGGDEEGSCCLGEKRQEQEEPTSEEADTGSGEREPSARDEAHRPRDATLCPSFFEARKEATQEETHSGCLAARGEALSTHANLGEDHSDTQSPLCISPPAAALDLWCQHAGVPCECLRAGADPVPVAGSEPSARPDASPSSVSCAPPFTIRQPVSRPIGAFLDSSLSAEKLRELTVPSEKLRRFIDFARPGCSHACSAARPPRAATRFHKNRERLADSPAGAAARQTAERLEPETPGASARVGSSISRGAHETQVAQERPSGEFAVRAECRCVCCQQGNCVCAKFAFRLDVVTPESTASSTFTKGYTANIHTGGPLLLVPASSPVSPSPALPCERPTSSRPTWSARSSSSWLSSSSSGSPVSARTASCVRPPGSALCPSVTGVGNPYQHVFATEELDKTRFQHDLRETDVVRFFSREELLRLHGYPPAFSFPDSIRDKKAASLVGNSVNVDVVAVLLVHLLLGFFSSARDALKADSGAVREPAP
ncbi:putative DNA methyltransferase 2 [Neospora caninum Liverpool]|uniref:DNA methyltransferase 2, putative n=1 Tax=Neospora caninum (strain Liverpool) TaxID=572307 RepID=F0VLK2_NEOCL|nr:putative DNA methyltransferase 2 [Neospora caninum Liverpool]CBZ54130.1 putative DNA methyltransferase 2 [Neospora caninum Liverpool]CEL68829.1 TPA: DNA methyltransferase 2, putative [Neospora caninum Liverpool]|eukprot:XP_003884161.1 putative DNA methyltransferase 2 [Neospora caninum Liverpool]